MRFSLLIPLFLLCAACAAAGEDGEEEDVKIDPARLFRIGDVAPEFPAGNWIKGPAVDFAELRGKVVLLYFLKPGCGSCDRFAPHLFRLILKHKDDFVVIGVAKESAKALEKYAEGKLVKYRLVRDPERALMSRYIGKISKYPYVAVIDKQGRLAWYGRGKFHSHVTEEVERALQAPPPPEPYTPIAGKRYALVVGVANEQKYVLTLDAVRADAKAVAALLRGSLGFERVELLLDAEDVADTELPTESKIRSALASLAGVAGPEDELVVFFTGRGFSKALPDGGRDIVLRTYDYQLTSFGLPLTQVRQILDDSDCRRRLVMIDINHDDGTDDAFKYIRPDLEKTFPSLPLLFSTARYDRSNMVYPPGGTARTLFVDLLLKGLRGPADLDDNGAVVPYELFRHIRDGMAAWTRRQGTFQSPMDLNLKAEPRVRFPVPAVSGKKSAASAQ